MYRWRSRKNYLQDKATWNKNLKIVCAEKKPNRDCFVLSAHELYENKKPCMSSKNIVRYGLMYIEMKVYRCVQQSLWHSCHFWHHHSSHRMLEIETQKWNAHRERLIIYVWTLDKGMLSKIFDLLSSEIHYYLLWTIMGCW